VSRFWLTIQFDEKSAFRPYGSDLVEFFNSTGWAVPMQLPDAAREVSAPSA
jgi:hypothetical protein